MVLIGYWPLNETSGSTAYDHSGQENHGTVLNSNDSSVVGESSGLVGGRAYNFDGSNDNVNLGANMFDSQFSGGSYSLVGWFKMRTLPSSRGKSEALIDVEGVTNLIVRNSDDKGRFRIYDGSTGVNIVTKSALNTGQWYQLAGVYDGSKMHLYLNGKKQSSNSSNNPNMSVDRETIIGSQNSNNGWQLDGTISEVRVYNHALTPREIQYLYTVSQRGRHVSGRKKS